MRLLLDEMFPVAIAEQLRGDGWDVIAVQEQPMWRELSDVMLLVVARQEHRAVVTENVKDFAPLAEAAISGEGHAGVVFTTNRSFPRHRPSFVGAIVGALGGLLAAEDDLSDRSHWLVGEP